MRGGPGVRLPPDAVPADRPAEPLTVLPTHRLVRGLDDGGRRRRSSSGARRALRRRAGRRRRTRCAAGSSRPALAAGGERPVRAVDARRRGAPDRAPRRRSSRSCRRAATRVRRARRRRCSGSPSSGCSGSSRTRSPPAPSRTRSPRPRPSTGSTRGTDGAMPRSSSSRRPVASIMAVAARRRRHAPEVDLLLPEGPDRPRHQPARMVSPIARPDSRRHPRPGPAARRSTAGRSARTRSSSTSAASTSSRGCPERRSRRKPLLFLHGELTGSWLWERYLGYFAGRGWEGHALNLRNHYWSQTADPAQLSFDTYTEDVVAALERLGPTPWWSATGWAACSRSRRPSGCRSRASSSSARSCRASSGRRPARTSCARSPRSTAGSVIGWETLPERLLRDHRDLTLADVLRIQHLLGQKPHEAGAARRQMLAGVSVDRRGVEAVPRLVIGGGLDRTVTAPTTPSGSPSGSTPSTSRSGRTRTTAWSSARRATSRSPTRSGRSSRRTASSGPRRRVRAGRGLWYHPDRSGRPAAATRRRIRLEAQDTALSRRRSPVRIRYAVPTRTHRRPRTAPRGRPPPGCPSVPLRLAAG